MPAAAAAAAAVVVEVLAKNRPAVTIAVGKTGVQPPAAAGIGGRARLALGRRVTVLARHVETAITEQPTECAFVLRSLCFPRHHHHHRLACFFLAAFIFLGTALEQVSSHLFLLLVLLLLLLLLLNLLLTMSLALERTTAAASAFQYPTRGFQFLRCFGVVLQPQSSVCLLCVASFSYVIEYETIFSRVRCAFAKSLARYAAFAFSGKPSSI